MTANLDLQIPDDLLPADGRFGSGPGKIRREALEALGRRHDLMGTSHRKPPVKALVARLKEGLARLHGVPDGYQVVLGNGGSTLMWDVIACSLTRRRAAFGVFGEFGSKAAKASGKAPFLAEPLVRVTEPGGVVVPGVTDDTDLAGVDVVAWPHNETSTGAAAPVRRPACESDALVVVDGTSAAGAMAFDAAETDVYYFAPQKNLASDGGLWIAFCSPAALERAGELTTDGSRWVPDTLNLALAASNSAKDQTLNTPALATLILAVDQVDWLLASGGMEFASARTRESSGIVYSWAENHALATPFVAPQWRSPVVATIDLDPSIPVAEVSRVLRDNGIVDVDGYRSLHRNQLRFGLYPAVDPADVGQLVACLDWVLERLAD